MPVDASKSEPPTDREVVITRHLDAPASVVFEAFTKPEHLMRWFGPKGWPLTMCEMDFREGGRYRFAMTGPHGKEGAPFGGRYLEIVPNRRIVYDDSFERAHADRLVITITFDEHQGRTTLTIRTLFPSVASKTKHLEGGYAGGVGSSLDQLRYVVADLLGAEHRDLNQQLTNSREVIDG